LVDRGADNPHRYNHQETRKGGQGPNLGCVPLKKEEELFVLNINTFYCNIILPNHIKSTKFIKIYL
jgi:hypothetical protein